MHRRALALLAAGLALAGCGGAEPVPLDIESLGPARTMMIAIPGAAPDAVTYEVIVSSSQLANLLDRRGAIELLVFDCAAPDGPGVKLPVYFGGEPVNGLAGHQVSGDREMGAQLSVAMPPAAGSAPRCARFVGIAGMMAPEVVSRPVPLPPG